jgi:hypothetical protein
MPHPIEDMHPSLQMRLDPPLINLNLFVSHVNNIVSKSSKRVDLLVQLKRAKVPTQYLSDEIERVQKRALRIVYPNLHYEDALIEAGMESLYK